MPDHIRREWKSTQVMREILVLPLVSAVDCLNRY